MTASPLQGVLVILRVMCGRKNLLKRIPATTAPTASATATSISFVVGLCVSTKSSRRSHLLSTYPRQLIISIFQQPPAIGSWSHDLLTDRRCGYCLLYTSDAADDLTRVDLGGRRIIKKKKKKKKKKTK